MIQKASVYLIPSFLHEAGLQALPAYLLEHIEMCDVFFVENERSARRYLKQLNKDLVIDHFEWFVIGKAEAEVLQQFQQKIKEGKTIGIISEAGCPGVADPGQLLVALAHEMGARVAPLVGPSSILLALMGSGMNGQRFMFHGYLPIDSHQRAQTLKALETESLKQDCTQIFIETPYRNQQLFESLLKNCRQQTRLCIAVHLTGPDEWIKTQTIARWKNTSIELHKKPAIYLLKG